MLLPATVLNFPVSLVLFLKRSLTRELIAPPDKLDPTP